MKEFEFQLPGDGHGVATVGAGIHGLWFWLGYGFRFGLREKVEMVSVGLRLSKLYEREKGEEGSEGHSGLMLVLRILVLCCRRRGGDEKEKGLRLVLVLGNWTGLRIGVGGIGDLSACSIGFVNSCWTTGWY